MGNPVRQDLNSADLPPHFNWQFTAGIAPCVVGPGERGVLFVYQPDATSIQYDGVLWWKYEQGLLTCYLDPDRDGHWRQMVTTPLPWRIETYRINAGQVNLQAN